MKSSYRCEYQNKHGSNIGIAVLYRDDVKALGINIRIARVLKPYIDRLVEIADEEKRRRRNKLEMRAGRALSLLDDATLEKLVRKFEKAGEDDDLEDEEALPIVDRFYEEDDEEDD